MAWWASCGYRSRCLKSADSEEDDEEDDDDGGSSVSSADSESGAIHYVLGDVTHPHTARGDAIIVHCVGMYQPPFAPPPTPKKKKHDVSAFAPSAILRLRPSR